MATVDEIKVIEIDKIYYTYKDCLPDFINKKPELHGKRIIFTDKSDQAILREKRRIN